MNTRKIQDMYFGFFELFKHKMIAKNVIKATERCLEPGFELTKEQKKQVRDFYLSYCKTTDIFHNFYTQKTGKFSPFYLPTDIYLNIVDEYFNCRAESKYLDNKCYYKFLFNDIPQAKVIVMRMGNIWYSADLQIITIEKVRSILEEKNEIFAKIATASYGGKGVAYISNEYGSISEQFEKFVSDVKSDIVVQEPFKQHDGLSRINESSVNTLRLISLLTESQVKIYSSIIRMGMAGQKVDNASSGGITCGITDDGKLKKYAYKPTGEKYTSHPSNGFVFEDYEIPGFAKAQELVKKAHPMVPHFKLVSWDIAIDENGEAVMIEANLAKGELDFHQLNNGPLFGEDTKKILDEVFNKKQNNKR